MYLPLIECFKWEVSYYSVGVQSWLLILEHLWILGPASWKGWWVIFPMQSTLHTTLAVRINQEKSPPHPLLWLFHFTFLKWPRMFCRRWGQRNSRLLDTLALCKPANCTGSPRSLTFHWKSLSFPPRMPVWTCKWPQLLYWRECLWAAPPCHSSQVCTKTRRPWASLTKDPSPSLLREKGWKIQVPWVG